MRRVVAVVALLLAGCSTPHAETPDGSRDAASDGIDADGNVVPGDPTDSSSASPTSAGPSADGNRSLAPGKGAIEGVVLDERYRPIADVALEITPGGRKVTTDGNGTFAVTDLEPAVYTLSPMADGYEGSAMEVEVVADAVSQVLLQMRGPAGPGFVLPVTAKEFSFTPADPTVTYEQLPFAVAIENAGLLGHDFSYSLVVKGDGQVLVSGSVAVAAGTTEEVEVPMAPLVSPQVRVTTSDGSVDVDVRDLELRFSDPTFALLGMDGVVTFRA